MKLKNIKKIENSSKRYDIQTSSQNFYANNILVHNSLLIVSRYKGQWIIRTRGTVDARQLPNGHEIDLLVKKYPWVFDNGHWDLSNALSGEGKSGTNHATMLFEWTTPTNTIVLREHDEPTLTLLGVIDNETGEYWKQETVDSFAALTVRVGRPETYHYTSLSECIADVTAWKGKEGVVIYSPDNQTLKKIKASEYCELHKIATGIKNVKNVLDVFMESPKFTNFNDFYKHIETLLDFEIAEKCKPFIQEITDAYSKFVKGVEQINESLQLIRNYATRKEQAAAIQQEFPNWKMSIAFLLLDNREIDDKVVRKTLEKILEL
jgi:hypothetical protein